MKKTPENDLHARAEAIRAEARRKCAQDNASSAAAAIAAFEQDETASYFAENALYVIGLVVSRLEAVRKGEPTFPLGTFDAETMSRLLTAETEADYEWEGFEEEKSDRDTIEAWKDGTLILTGYLMRIATPTTEKQRNLIDALVEYATAAAVAARTLRSSSLQDWAGMIDILRNRPRRDITCLNPDEAQRLIALERSAADRLRLDTVIAELPQEPPSQKRARGK